MKLMLSRYGLSDNSVLCVDSKPGKTIIGHADGINARTMEILATIGLEHGPLKHGNEFINAAEWVLGDEGIIKSIERKFYFSPARFGQMHTCHQGRFETWLSDDLKAYSTRGVQYNSSVEHVTVDSSDPDYPVRLVLQEANGTRTIRTKYLVGADGARSAVRRSFDIEMQGDIVDQIWGAIEFVVDTDFPDIRKVGVFYNTDRTLSQAVLVPRERMSNGEYLTRFTLNMRPEFEEGSVTVTGEAERAQVKQIREQISSETILQQLEQLFKPYKIKVKTGTQVFWWATYQTGQRLAEKYIVEDKARHPRVFLMGDGKRVSSSCIWADHTFTACHTHSPRQAQGLNISVPDAYYLSWRLAYSILGLTPPSTSSDLLRTYELERRAWAQRVVHADKRWNQDGLPREQVINEMRSQMLGCGVEETPSMLVSEKNDGVEWQGKDLLMGTLRTGRRLFNVKVTRFADELSRDIHEDFISDGKYRILMLSPNEATTTEFRTAIETVCSVLDDFTPMVELVLLIAKGDGVESLGWNDFPKGLKKHAEMSVYIAGPEVYATYGVDQGRGTMALVRPDGMVAITTFLDDANKIRKMLDRVLLPQAKPN